MKLIQDFNALPELRRFHLLSMFFGKTLNTSILIVITFGIIGNFGAEGMVVKNQLIALYSLILLLPGVASLAGKTPVKSLKIVFVFEILATLGFLFAGMDIHAIYLLPLALLMLHTTNLFMKSLIAQVASIVTAGCAKFCDIQTQFDSVCTVFGAAIALLFVYLELTAVPIVAFTMVMLFGCRYYRFKTYYIIFGENDEVKADEIKLELQTD